MKITFPYMGPTFAYKKLFELLGHEVISPTRPSRRTVALGVKNSPEFICFPFKIILGSFIEAVEHGAEVIITSGGIGACRAVYYGRLSEQILRQLGYNVRVLVFDTPFENGNQFWSQCKEIKNGKSLMEFIKAFNLTIRTVYASDNFQKKLNHLRPYELVPGICDRKWLEIQDLLRQSNDLNELQEKIRRANQIIAKIPVSFEKTVLKVGLAGEIYLVMESAANFDLESKLAALGVEAVNSWYISDWITHCFLPPRRMLRQTEHYLKCEVGGHERESIGHIMEYKKRGFDGVIHLMPFGCMPELITQTIIPALSVDLDLPILSLSLDEQSGWVNNQIRIEAFTELLWNRKELKDGINGKDLFGC